MARAEEKHVFMSAYSPVREDEQQTNNNDFEEAVSGSGCGCFRLCCFGWRQGNQESNRLLHQNGQNGEEDSWFVNKLKKLKEFSELVAGPKWKNLVRKMGKYCNPKKSRTQTMYSPQSYALNFDDGEGEDDDDLFAGFSTRFSAPLNQQRTGSS